ncbi:MAG: S41 family peptidase [Bacteroidaceae bacterium]|nr:S41 family peptidase [Bacteroidaceae bacterium]
MKRISRILLIAIFIATSSFQTAKADEQHKLQLSRQLSIFNSIVKELNLFYVDSIMPEKMIERSISAMLRSLDPYTIYYSEEESDELKMMTTGKYAGIGSIIRYHTDKKTTVLSEPYEGMPAHKAGLQAGDLIISIDGKPVKEMSTDSVSNMLRGEPGTKLMLEIERPGKKGTMTFRIERASISLPPISYYGMLDSNTGHIILDSFTEECAKEMRKAVVDLKKQGAESFVIDLRNNGGGLLNEAVEIVNLFVPKGKTIVTTKGKIKQSNEEYVTRKEPIDEACPLAILVNGQSASASEILAGALQDLDRAVIIGSRTFGKGLVQSSRSVNGGGVLKLTTAKYYIPSGRCVQALDYSHMLEDGRSSRIPDSLTTVFHTAAGREVRDGGGIRPDLEPKTEELSTLLYYLLQDMAMFDFATEFKLKNDTIAPASEFKIDDTTYSEFCEYLKSKNFSYDLRSVKMLGDLKKMIEFEGLGNIVKEELKALEEKLNADLDLSLEHFKKDIKDLLADEIIKRYYGQKGSIVYSLREDVDIKEACRILNNRDEYSRILKPAPSNEANK